MGAERIADETARLKDRLRRQTGLEPVVIAQHYGRASQLAFYLPGRPVVYCSSSRMAGRRTQYDYWPDTDLDDMAVLRGRPGVLLGATGEQWRHAFERVQEHGVLDGEHKEGRLTFLGYRYKGFR
jgi:peptidoglycan/xylan/chitin deacetylase (PgdA/CDA1 family)